MSQPADTVLEAAPCSLTRVKSIFVYRVSDYVYESKTQKSIFAGSVFLLEAEINSALTFGPLVC